MAVDKTSSSKLSQPSQPSPALLPLDTIDEDHEVQYVGQSYSNSAPPPQGRGGNRRGFYPRVFRGSQYARSYATEYQQPVYQQYPQQNQDYSTQNSVNFQQPGGRNFSDQPQSFVPRRGGRFQSNTSRPSYQQQQPSRQYNSQQTNFQSSQSDRQNEQPPQQGGVECT